MFDSIVDEIRAEREYQDKRWGTKFDDTHSPYEWAGFINRYATKDLIKTTLQDTNLNVFRNDMIRVAAIAVAAVEAIDRSNTNV